MSGDAEIVRVAERALLVRFPDSELSRAVGKAQAVFLEAKGERPSLKGKRRVVLGAGSLLVTLDHDTGERELDQLRAELEASVRRATVEAPELAAGREHRIEVRYGGEDGPDLAAVARETGLSPERVVGLHAGAEYTVAFVGFAPGFPYLIGLPPELQVPRLESPRTRVPAGSVAIAGPFSAVYPCSTPGGWRLLGRTPAALFEPAAESPALLAPGDRVRFVDVSSSR